MDTLASSPWLWALFTFLVLGATLRLSRFVTTDTLGGWLLEPVKRWAEGRERVKRRAIEQVLADIDPADPKVTDDGRAYLLRLADSAASGEKLSWQARLASGLDCPFCVGFWLGFGILTVTFLVLVTSVAWLVASWGVLLAALTLNYIVGHISARID